MAAFLAAQRGKLRHVAVAHEDRALAALRSSLRRHFHLHVGALVISKDAEVSRVPECARRVRFSSDYSSTRPYQPWRERARRIVPAARAPGLTLARNALSRWQAVGTVMPNPLPHTEVLGLSPAAMAPAPRRVDWSFFYDRRKRAKVRPLHPAHPPRAHPDSGACTY
jgi:hypothetical protein